MSNLANLGNNFEKSMWQLRQIQQFEQNSTRLIRQGNDLTWVRYHADDHTADADDDHDELPGLVASAGLEFESWATQAGIEI